MKLEQAGPHQEGLQGNPSLSLVWRTMANPDVFQLKRYGRGRTLRKEDVEEINSRDKETSSETFDKPTKSHRWLEFFSDII